MKEIVVFVYLNKEEVPADKWAFLIDKLPKSLHQNISRFRRWQDRQASLFGKLLLARGLKMFGYPDPLLEQLQIDQYNRPSLPISLDFNISHSGDYVVCVLSPDRIGIDIERIRSIKLHDFRSVLTGKELEILSQTNKPEILFFEIWSKKEAAIKAEGKGFSNSLKHTEALGNKLFLENQWWILKEIFINSDYKCFLASPQNIGDIKLQFVSF